VIIAVRISSHGDAASRYVVRLWGHSVFRVRLLGKHKRILLFLKKKKQKDFCFLGWGTLLMMIAFSDSFRYILVSVFRQGFRAATSMSPAISTYPASVAPSIRASRKVAGLTTLGARDKRPSHVYPWRVVAPARSAKGRIRKNLDRRCSRLRRSFAKSRGGNTTNKSLFASFSSEKGDSFP
jgi:hypothetical protein